MIPSTSTPRLVPLDQLLNEHAESAAELSTILDGFDDLMITYADRMIADDPVWSQMKAQRQALLEIMT
jgi:hypothetical protein